MKSQVALSICVFVKQPQRLILSFFPAAVAGVFFIETFIYSLIGKYLFDWAFIPLESALFLQWQWIVYVIILRTKFNVFHRSFAEEKASLSQPVYIALHCRFPVENCK